MDDKIQFKTFELAQLDKNVRLHMTAEPKKPKQKDFRNKNNRLIWATYKEKHVVWDKKLREYYQIYKDLTANDENV